MSKIQDKHHKTFEQIRQTTDEGREFWSARDLMVVLEYRKWENFEAVILKAIDACNNSGINSDDHFPEVRKMVRIGAGASRTVTDYNLSRYACYLIVQNADPSKPVIAYGQTYFALQTRRRSCAVIMSGTSTGEAKSAVRFV